MQEHVELLVRARGHVGEDAVLRGADAPARAQERKAVQVLEACARARGLRARTGLDIFNARCSAARMHATTHALPARVPSVLSASRQKARVAALERFRSKLPTSAGQGPRLLRPRGAPTPSPARQAGLAWKRRPSAATTTSAGSRRPLARRTCRASNAATPSTRCAARPALARRKNASLDWPARARARAERLRCVESPGMRAQRGVPAGRARAAGQSARAGRGA